MIQFVKYLIKICFIKKKLLWTINVNKKLVIKIFNQKFEKTVVNKGNETYWQKLLARLSCFDVKTNCFILRRKLF